jgi:hypothetical protein
MCQSEVEAVGEQPGHEDPPVGHDLAGPQVGEDVGEACPAVHLGQQVGDPHPRQQAVEAHGQGLGLRRRRFGKGGDLQHALVERHVGQQAALRLGVGRGQALVQHGPVLRNEMVKVDVDRDRQGAVAPHLRQGGRGDEAVLEGPVLPAARHPNVAGAQPITQFRQHAQLIIAPVDGAARQDMAHPAWPDESRRRRCRQGRGAGAVDHAQNLDGAQKRGGGRNALEGERLQERRRPTAHPGVMLAQHLQGVELLAARQRFGLRHARAEPLPRDHRGDRREGVPLVIVGVNQGGTDLGVETHLVVDGASVGLEGPGMPALGLAKHRPDQPVEEIDGLVGQAGAEIQRDGHQSGVAALPLQAGEMLHRGSAGLAGQLGQACL